jgi:ribosome-associated heat shock protein Hsp15
MPKSGAEGQAGLCDLPVERQRIDKWLWHARVVRTRVAAAALAEAGHVRVNGQRIDAPGRPVRCGDVVTVALDRSVRVIRVLGFVERRGSADQARVLLEDLTARPSAAERIAAEASVAARDPHTGRPTKHERRAIERLLGSEES